MSEDLTPIARLNKDLREASRKLTNSEARYLVDLYYTIQNNRIRAMSQVRASSDSGEPNEVIKWSFDNFRSIESGCKSALHSYVKSTVVGEWMLSIHGIGPVIAAGMMAHIDITKAPTAGHIWRFAGLDPTVKWEKKNKRPWNAALKTLCWKTGQSFMKLRNSENDFYGKVYEARKALEITRNENGDYAATAREQLEAKNYGQNQTREHLESGKLSPAQIDARARRYAVKMFLSHLHHVMYEDYYNMRPPRPYVIEHLGHAHYIEPPNWRTAMPQG